MIYHIVVESEFRARLNGPFYRPGNLASDGFVHCSLQPSVLPVANDYFAHVAGQTLVIEIDPAQLTSETRYEKAAPLDDAGSSHLAGSTLFPHVYGPLDIEAITAVGVLRKGVSGYEWPDAFESLNAFLGHTPS